MSFSIEVYKGDKKLLDKRVNPEFCRKAEAVLRDVRKGESGYPLFVVEVYRAVSLQRKLYCQGRSTTRLLLKGITLREILSARRAGYMANEGVVTNMLVPKMHGKGLAMDCAFIVDGKLRYDVPKSWWEAYMRSAESHGLTCGGKWKIKDMGHVQLGG